MPSANENLPEGQSVVLLWRQHADEESRQLAEALVAVRCKHPWRNISVDICDTLEALADLHQLLIGIGRAEYWYDLLVHQIGPLDVSGAKGKGQMTQSFRTLKGRHRGKHHHNHS